MDKLWSVQGTSSLQHPCSILVSQLVGPLLFHFADMPREASLELPWEDIRMAVLKIGFVIEVSMSL